MKPRNADLLALVGKNVEVITTENETYTGVLIRELNHFTVDSLEFKVSHIKSIKESRKNEKSL